MKKQILTVSAVCLLAACSGFKPDYTVTDASKSSKPFWTTQSKTAKIDSSSERKTNRYYVANAVAPEERTCLRSAEANATRKIAAEVAQEIAAQFEESRKATGETADIKMKDKLQQIVDTNLHGVVVAETYWEKRSYQKQLGAAKDYVGYKCDVAVKIKKSALIEALEMYKAKTIRGLSEKDKKDVNAAVDNYVAELKSED